MQKLFSHLAVCCAAAATLVLAPKTSAQNVWIGVSGTSLTTNWSDVANWSTGMAPAGDQVLFYDNGAVAAGVINNVVDAAFGGSAGSLQFANTNNSHTTLIPNGVTLSVGGSLIAGTEVAVDIAGKTNTITGAGSLVAGTPGANFIVRQWPSTASSSASRTTLDMSGLGSFTGTFDRLLIGVAGSGGGNRASGRLLLARTNVITLSGSDPQLDLGDSASNNGNGSQLLLGQTNALFANSLTIGRYKERAVLMSFMAGLSSPKLYLRGSDTMSRVNSWVIGYMGSGSGTANAQGTVDLSAGMLDGQVDVLDVGKASDYTGSSGTTGPATGTLTFNGGTLDVNTLRIGYQPRGTSSAATTSGQGTVNVNGTAQLLVNTTVTLGASTGGTGVASTYGTLNINGGRVITPALVANAGGTNNVITISGNGRLVISNTVGAGVRLLAMTNGTLMVPVANGTPALDVVSAAVDGNNTISISHIPTVSGYPAQLPVVKYAGTLAGTFNFVLGTLPPSTPPYAGYISNNTANGSIDLILTSGEVPARALAWRGNVSSSWDTSTANWLFNGSSATYNDKDFVRFDDTASGTTSVSLTGPMSPSSITVSNVSKAYTFAGPGSLTGGTGLTKDGAGTLTIANDVQNDFTGPIALIAGTLRYNQTSDHEVPNVITGSGALAYSGSGTLTLSGANSLDGPITVTQGTLKAGNASALGSTNGATTVQSGATLDVNGLNLGAEPVIASGTGAVGAGGAIINSGANIYPALRNVTLAGHTTFAGIGRWDIRYTSSGATDPALSTLSTGGNAYNLTKVAANYVGLCNVTVDPALADVVIQEGTLSLQYNTTGLGNPDNTVTVATGAFFDLYNLTNQFAKKIVLSDQASLQNSAGANTIIGPVTLNGTGLFSVNGTSLALSGTIGGPGNLSKNGTGTLVIDGNGSALTQGVNLNAGTLMLNGTLGGGLTNQVGSSFIGSGTNTGVVDVYGSLFAGASNVVGTLTVGGLILEPGAMVWADLGSTTTPGAGVNDLIVVNGDLVISGNQLTVNPLNLLQKNVPYRLFTYTGKLVWNGDLWATTSAAGYSFTINTNTPGQVNLLVTDRPPAWTGGSAVSSNWSDPANWGGTVPPGGSALFFDGNQRLSNFNDTGDGTQYGDIGFTSMAGPFVLNGNTVTLGGNINNYSSNDETINLNLNLGGTYSLNGASGRLIIGGSVINTANNTILDLAGSGILSNRLASVDPNSLTNALRLSSTNANWTFVDNVSAAPVSLPVQLDVQAGTFNFGTASSAPVLTNTIGGTTVNSRVGAIANTPATFNMVNGTLVIGTRFNLGNAANVTATYSQSGGLLSIMDVFQASDNSGSDVSFVNVSGGTLSVGESEASPNTLFLCSRGRGTLTVNGTGLVRCGALDMSRNASGAGSVGIVNLDGGRMEVERVGTGTSSYGAGGTPSATFRFNGGTLKARINAANFFQGRAEIPIAAIVESGGALIDSAEFAITVSEPLQHDSSLGTTPDGGLVKNGAGTLTLAGANSYTGPTLVNGGTLLVNGSLAAGAVTVAAGATLGGNGTIGGPVSIDAAGGVSPGAGWIGALTFSTPLSLHGTTTMDLGTGTNDVIKASALTFDGTLRLVFTNVLTAGNSFKLFSASSYSGAFTLDPPTPGSGLAWDTGTLATDGTLRVVQAVNPAPTDITYAVVGGNLQLSWPADHIGWHLLAQTNSLSVGIAANWVEVPGSTTTNRIFITPSPANGTVFYRLVYTP